MIIQKVSQIFCDQSYTGCCRNSTTTQTLSLAENLRLFIRWVSQKFCNHSQTGCQRDSEKKYYIDTHHTFELVLELLPNKSQNKEKEIELNNVYKAICRRSLVQFI